VRRWEWKWRVPTLSLQGSPWLAKTGVSGAAIGVQAKGVRRFLLLKIATVVRGP
jgi:hypothetical protein